MIPENDCFRERRLPARTFADYIHPNGNDFQSHRAGVLQPGEREAIEPDLHDEAFVKRLSAVFIVRLEKAGVPHQLLVLCHLKMIIQT